MTKSPRSHWPLVAAGTALVGATYGLGRYAYGLYLPTLRAELGLSAATAGAVASATYGAYCLGLVAGAAVAERGGARAAALAAGSFLVAGTAAIAVADCTALLALGVALGGVSTGLASPALASLVAAGVPPAGRDRAMTVVNAGTGFGVLVCAPAALVAPDRWRAAFVVFGALGLAVTGAVAAASGGARPVARGPSRRAIAAARRRVGRDRIPLALGAVGLGAAGSAYWTFGRDLLSAAGAGGTGPVLWMALGAASILGALAGDVVARGDGGALWGALLVALGGSTALLALAPASLPLALASAVAFGASFVALSGILIVWATRLDADRPAAAVSGAFVLLALGGVAGAPVVGALIDRGGWLLGFAAAAGVAFACAPLSYTPAARRALACAASSSASSGSGASGASTRSAVAISQSANQAFLGSSGPCR